MKINAEKFKKLLYLQGLTQIALAEKTGINLRTIQSYASGGKTPRADKAAEIAKVLKCNINDFVE